MAIKGSEYSITYTIYPIVSLSISGEVSALLITAFLNLSPMKAKIKKNIAYFITRQSKLFNKVVLNILISFIKF